MSRILVVCYSRCGTTLEVATRIAERCGADLELIKDKTPRDGFLGWLRSAFEARMRRQPWIQPPRRAVGDYALVVKLRADRMKLRLMTFLGFAVSMLSFLAGLVYLAIKLMFWYSLPVGIAPVLIAVFFLGSIQLFALGVVGEYIGLLLNYARNFPLVIEKERINF